MASGPALTLCAMTVRGASFTERLRAAAAAGFDSIGLSLDQYRAALQEGLDDRRLRFLLDDHGLRVTEIEAPWDWAAGGPPGADASARAVDVGTGSRDNGDLLFHALEALRCEQFNAVAFTAYPHEHLVERFTALCARAATVGARVALEFMPFSELRTLPAAWRLVRESGAPNAGVLLDHWHYVRSGGTPDDLAAVPPERILSVQLNDVQLNDVQPRDDLSPGEVRDQDDLREEARHRRLLPGDGAARFVRLLRRHGVTARMSVEVWSDDLERLAPTEAARLAYEAADRVLTETARLEGSA
ncbi:IolI protein [Actinomadura sp. NBRC 104412]|uniref:sugar phosphate isomerase/epimerase family protein n=1 Tax=Actinomadura sp. NBRC 104412 TaxID=3032203 RepID=UPI0024A432A2|nr:sugar phosphate isomerase/epimerase family protein [Actinomadura sp. NBRC 104412]GLZ09203.1 IolI protein [Actinomadura sp. NBRC 104412]